VTDETKGREARAILDNEVYREAEAMTKADVLKRWEAERDSAKRDALWMELQGLGATRRALQTLADRGEKATHDRTRQEARINA